MALPATTFSNAKAGILVVTWSATRHINRVGAITDDVWDCVIRGKVGPSGSLTYTDDLNFASGGSTTLVLAYPGGSVSWDLGFINVSHKFGGIGVVGWSEMRVSATLFKA